MTRPPTIPGRDFKTGHFSLEESALASELTRPDLYRQTTFIKLLYRKVELSPKWPLIKVSLYIIPPDALHQTTLYRGRSLIKVASHQGFTVYYTARCPSSNYSIQRSVSHQSGLSSWFHCILYRQMPFIKLLYTEVGLSSKWSLIMVSLYIILPDPLHQTTLCIQVYL